MDRETMRSAISMVQQEIEKLQKEVRKKKETINSMSEIIGDPLPYPEVGEEVNSGAIVARSDEFYGKPLATVVRMILERRGRANLGAATVPEIYELMKLGGYHFTAKNDDNNRRVLHSAIAKNTATFHRLPSGGYGLREWYSNIKEPRQKAVVDERADEDTEAAEFHEQFESKEGNPDVPKHAKGKSAL